MIQPQLTPVPQIRLRFGLVALLLAVLAAPHLLFGGPVEAQEESSTRFRVSFPASVHDSPVTGRVFVMISRTTEREPRLQIGRDGVPFFGRDVMGLAAGEPGIIGQTDLGSPVESLSELPPGEYFVQGMVNIYTEFRRSDGNVLWMHNDQWEGQAFQRSPGNLYSDVQRVRLDPEAGYDFELVAEHIIPPIEMPEETEWVKRFRFQSPLLTEFWGEPIYLGATILLPRDYDESTISYPVLYRQGHFSAGAPLRFEEGGDLHEEWIRDDFPRMIVVTFQHDQGQLFCRSATIRIAGC